MHFVCLKSLVDGGQVDKKEGNDKQERGSILYHLPMYGASGGSMKRDNPFMSDSRLKGSPGGHDDLLFDCRQRYHVSELYGPVGCMHDFTPS